MFWTVCHGKVMLFQCLIDVIKTYGGVKVHIRAVLTAALCVGVWSAARPKERAIGTGESVFILVPSGIEPPTVCHVQYPNPCTELFRCTTDSGSSVLLWQWTTRNSDRTQNLLPIPYVYSPDIFLLLFLFNFIFVQNVFVRYRFCKSSDLLDITLNCRIVAMFVFVPYKTVCLIQCHVWSWMCSAHCCTIFHISCSCASLVIPNELPANDAFSHGCLKADSHIACRSHAAPMPFPCHAVPLRV